MHILDNVVWRTFRWFLDAANVCVANYEPVASLRTRDIYRLTRP